jgi:quercetin dioxygenase-like cupin family protein
MRPTQINITAPLGGQSVAFAGGSYRMLVTGDQTNNEFAVIDMIVPPHAGPNPHAHAQIQESFYMIEGELTFRTETQTYVARKGAFIEIPLGGTIHNFKNETGSNAHVICMVAPAGMEKMFLELGEPVGAGELRPMSPPAPEELKRIMAIAEKYGQELFPPDYFEK